MTPADVREKADMHRDENPRTAQLLDALADVQEAAANLLRIEPDATMDRQVALAEVLARRVARVEALPP